MDMFEFRNMMAQDYNISDVDMGLYDRVAVVKFDYDERGVVSGRCRFGIVFRDRDSESTILPGETWVCSLTQNTPRQYFGKALMKVDASLLYGLTVEQLEGITDALWENQKDDILAIMEEKYRNSVEEEIQARITEQVKTYQDRIEEMESNIIALEKKNDEYLIKLGEADDAMAEMKIRMQKAEGGAAPRPAEKPKTGHQGFKVLRVAEEKIYSESFRDGTYRIFFTADGRSVRIIPSQKGKAVCIDGMLTVNGLDRYAPFGDAVSWDAVADGTGKIELSVAAE